MGDLAGEVNSPRWTPDGQRIAFAWPSEGIFHLTWQRTDGTAGPELLARESSFPSPWSPNGKQHALASHEDDIVIASLENGKAAFEPLGRTPAIEQWPQFSPDGRWLAYGSDASGRNEFDGAVCHFLWRR